MIGPKDKYSVIQKKKVNKYTSYHLSAIKNFSVEKKNKMVTFL